MQSDTFHQKINNGNRWLLLFALTIVLAAPLLIWNVKHGGQSSEKVSVSGQSSVSGNGEINIEPGIRGSMDDKKTTPAVTASALSEVGVETIKAMQRAAAEAAIDADPIEGSVSRRPEFVSEVEWEVLNEAVAENKNMTGDLLHFVNKLLFFKKRDAWMDTATPLKIRRKLAGDLLNMIPNQVEEMAIDKTFADQLTADLNTFLSTVTP